MMMSRFRNENLRGSWFFGCKGINYIQLKVVVAITVTNVERAPNGNPVVFFSKPARVMGWDSAFVSLLM